MSQICFRFVVAISAALPLLGAGSGTITGRVTADGKAPAVGVTVRFDKVRTFKRAPMGQMAPAEEGVNGTVRTRADGSFSIGGIPAGQYYLCALATRNGQLNSCEWGTEPAPVTVVPGRESTGIALNLRSGVLLRIRVSDNAGRIASDEDFRAGILTSAGHFKEASFEGAAGRQRVYTVAVPHGTSGILMLDSPHEVVTPSGVRARELPVEVPREAVQHAMDVIIK